MQDDCYLIVSDGWKQAVEPKLVIEEKGKKAKEVPDFVLDKKKFITELIPVKLIVTRFFRREQDEIAAIEIELLEKGQEIDDMAEEHGGENGLLEDARNEKDKLTKASVSARLKEIKGDADLEDEIEVLKEYLNLIEQDAILSGKLKAEQAALISKVANKYAQLSEDEIKVLVVEDKWIAALASSVQGELDRVSQTLTSRIHELADRYSTPLPSLSRELSALSERVNEHLKNMGIKWN